MSINLPAIHINTHGHGHNKGAKLNINQALLNGTGFPVEPWITDDCEEDEEDDMPDYYDEEEPYDTYSSEWESAHGQLADVHQELSNIKNFTQNIQRGLINHQKNVTVNDGIYIDGQAETISDSVLRNLSFAFLKKLGLFRDCDEEASLVYYSPHHGKLHGLPAFDFVFKITGHPVPSHHHHHHSHGAFHHHHANPHFVSFRLGYDSHHFKSLDDVFSKKLYCGNSYGSACKCVGLKNLMAHPMKQYKDCTVNQTVIDKILEMYNSNVHQQIGHDMAHALHGSSSHHHHPHLHSLPGHGHHSSVMVGSSLH